MVENQYQNIKSEQDVWSLYLYAMKSPVTRQKYTKRLEKFFDFLAMEGKTIEDKSISFVNKARFEGDQWVFNNVLKFMQFQLGRANRKEITCSTVRNYLKSITTIEEIRKLLEYPDRRLKAIIYTMASSGIRLGAWDYLKWGHIRPIEKDGKVVAAKIIVYAVEEDEYFSFISAETYKELKSWMDYRSFSGELINEDSWLMRDLWDTGII
ncbi:MAG: hypothetical protein ACTHL3_03740 [Candidatus Nitrosocosmicus sp.]